MLTVQQAEALSVVRYQCTQQAECDVLTVQEAKLLRPQVL